MATASDILAARALYYSLFSRLFVFNVEKDRFEGVSKMLGLIGASSLDDESNAAAMRLSANFIEPNPQSVIDEYDDIFHAPPRPLRNSFSYYDEGYEVGHACADIKRLLLKTDIRRDEKKFKENEDSVGFVFTIMSEFIQRIMDGKGEYEEFSAELFKKIINPCIDEFCDKLFMHDAAKIYKDAAILLKNFIEFERIYYDVAKPISDSELNKKSSGLSRSETIRREKNRVRKLKSQGEG
ncbi:TorD/DmsD family molecular chaperone [Campylobacter sp.]|uniref:TorD/DmsD family molecular chaperone n=1 Tax=Campylobacter sp. TaxID=205 RepID=UPI0027060278|nr:molecular chaperone TorD family protein [Campylobacter sp.]